MKWFNNLKMIQKLVSAFVLVALFTMIVGVIGVINIKNSSTVLYKNITLPMSDLVQIN